MDLRDMDVLMDTVDDASILYTDFPPLPDFPCMSTSSSSSSSPFPTDHPVASASCSSSASSFSATSWAVLKSEGKDYSERKKHRHHSSQSHECRDQVVDAASAAVAAVLSSTASMEVLPGPDDCNRDDCINVMENFGYMDLLDSSDNWDPSAIYESETPQDQFQEKKPAAPHKYGSQQSQNQHSQEKGHDRNGGNDQLQFLQGNSELAVIFLEWLKQNKDHISAEDMRNIKLKRSTIECASKRLGSTKEGKKQLLKLILEWVEQYQLQKKRTRDQLASDSDLYHYLTANPNPNTDLNCNSVPPPDPNTCFTPSQWVPPPPPSPCVPELGNLVAVPASFPPIGGGYVCDPYSSGAPVPAPNQSINRNLYPPTSEYQPMDSPHSWTAPPLPRGVQYNPLPDNSNLPVSGSLTQGVYGNPYPYTVFDGNGERLVRLGASATKEARKKRMARISLHQYRHHKNQNQHQNLMSEQHPRSVGDDCTSSPANPGNWIFWSPPAAATGAAPPASSIPSLVSPVETSHIQTQPVNRGNMQAHNNHQRQAPSDRKQGCKTQKNLKFLLQKVLKRSDVGNLGRIVLPKKEAETHLPELKSRDGIAIAMEDIGTSNVWNMRYRFRPNNKSRMYLLENTGNFVRVNGLQEGDFIVIYSDTKCGKYLIRGVKVRQLGIKSEGKKPAR